MLLRVRVGGGVGGRLSGTEESRLHFARLDRRGVFWIMPAENQFNNTGYFSSESLYHHKRLDFEDTLL